MDGIERNTQARPAAKRRALDDQSIDPRGEDARSSQGEASQGGASQSGVHQAGPNRAVLFATLLLFIAPALFASNMLVARSTYELIPPIALAFWRWLVTLLLLLPFIAGTLWRQRQAIRREWADLVFLGALGMGVCGAFVYIGAATTSATNIGLIYAASPVLIILLARWLYGEAVSPRQIAGVALSLCGVLGIICKGDPAVLLELRFTVGDLWILAAMIAWALYSVLLKHRHSDLGLQTRFAAICAGGVVVLAPFHLWEIGIGQVPRLDRTTVASVLFLAVVASLGAYQAYALIQKTLGAARTGLLMYLIPVYNGGLAYLFLNETLELYHALGAALVLPGVYLATHRAQPKPPSRIQAPLVGLR